MGSSNPEVTVDGGAVDSHSHLFLCDREPTVTVEAARAAGVDRVICVGVDVASSLRSLELADSLEGVFATAGMHPHDAQAFNARASGRIEELLHDPRVLAVGECGLDYYRMLSPREDQIHAFRAHVALSRATGKPLIVHVRDAWPDVLELLETEGAERVVIHCFSGDAEVARECVARGYWISFAGNVTYPKNEHLREAAAVVPSDRLLAETDSPFLAPQKLRGTENEPANVLITLQELANVKGSSLEEMVSITAKNARQAFPGLR